MLLDFGARGIGDYIHQVLNEERGYQLSSEGPCLGVEGKISAFASQVFHLKMEFDLDAAVACEFPDEEKVAIGKD